MPHSPSYLPESSRRITLRFDEQTDHFLRQRSKASGKSLSDFLKGLIHEGLVAQKAEEIEMRLQALVDQVGSAGQFTAKSALVQSALYALFSVEEAMQEILRQRDPNAWKAVRARAQKRVDEEVHQDGDAKR